LFYTDNAAAVHKRCLLFNKKMRDCVEHGTMEFEAGVMSPIEHVRFLWLSTEHTFTGASVIVNQQHRPLLSCYGPTGSHLKGIIISAKVMSKFITGLNEALRH
jgi:hypothetical protein